MLTVDDANSILGKYGDNGFWHSIDLGQFDISNISSVNDIYFNCEWFILSFKLVTVSDVQKVMVRIYYNNSACTTMMYTTYSDDTLYPTQVYPNDGFAAALFDKTSFVENPPIFHIYLTNNQLQSYDTTLIYELLFVPLQSIIIQISNGNYNDKFYIKPIGNNIDYYIIDNQRVSLEEDENGKFLRLPPHDCIVGVHGNTRNYNFYKITFKESKTLPIPYIPSLYRGTPQKITLINSDTEEPITEFQAYYQGRLLRDNIIELPYDAPDYIDIVVDLLDPKYPKSTLKLKAQTSIYTTNSQSDVEEAIEEGIKTIQAYDNSPSGVLLVNEVELKDVTFINSSIRFIQSKLDNVTIIETESDPNRSIAIQNGTVLNNCIIQDLTRLRIQTGNELNNCTLKSINRIESYGLSRTQILQITGTIMDCNIEPLVIISDGDIILNNNTFTGKSNKKYLPNFLYLTGDYTVINNTFNLTGNWGDLQFNMCIIKATNNFNVNEFIKNNTFQLNITYEDEPTNTLYYNIVDDDKIRAVRL